MGSIAIVRKFWEKSHYLVNVRIRLAHTAIWGSSANMSGDDSATWWRRLESREGPSIEENSEVVIANSGRNIGSAVAIAKASAPFAAGDKMPVSTLHFVLEDEKI